LKFAADRQRYRIRLREALLDSGANLLTYNITRNHVHLLALFRGFQRSLTRALPV
jgi:REP element-mobilizing transposase RayT